MKVSELMSKENCNEVGYTQPYVRKLPSKTEDDQVPSTDNKDDFVIGLALFLVMSFFTVMFLMILCAVILPWILTWISQHIIPIVVLVAAGILFVFWCLSFDDVVEEEPFEFTFPNAKRKSGGDHEEKEFCP